MAASALFSDKSFFCLGPDNPRFSILMILVNSITLGLVDPCDVHCQKPSCSALEIVEHVIFGFFAAEMVIKMIAMGVIGKKSYLSESWNCFDFFIISAGLAEYLFPNKVINVTAIRALRVLRPLRAINRISSLRLLVTLILDILPMLFNVMAFCFLAFVIFGIIAVQLWAGTLRNRCFMPSPIVVIPPMDGRELATHDIYPPPYMPKFYQPPQKEYVCSISFGLRKCENIPQYEAHHSMCDMMFSEDEEKFTICAMWVNNYTECRPVEGSAGQGLTNFDNIFYASLAIFQVISLEGWCDIMYLVQDAVSFWAWTYFVVVVLFGSYFAAKLCLVIIASQFSVTRLREQELIQKEMEERGKKIRQSSMDSADSGHNEDDGCYMQVIKLIYHVFHRLFRNISCQRVKCRTTSTRQASKSILSQMFGRHRNVMRKVAENETAQTILTLAILANAIIMGMEHYGQPKQLTNFIEASNVIFTLIYSFEIFMKLYGYGPRHFLKDSFNAFESVVIILNIIELTIYQKADSGLSVLRLFRLLRLVKILRFFPVLHRQLTLMVHTIDNVASFFFLFGFLLYIAALLGLHLFGCKFCQPPPRERVPPPNITDPEATIGGCHFMVLSLEKYDELSEGGNNSFPVNYTTTLPPVLEPEPFINQEDPSHCTNANFDTLLQASFTVLQVFTGDNWGNVMRDGMFFTSDWAAIYFVILVAIGEYIIFNLLIGILVEGFSAKNEEELEKKLILPRKSVIYEDGIIDGDHNKSILAHRLSSKSQSKYRRDSVADRSLFIFARNNPLRWRLRKIISSKWYQTISLLITLSSCTVIVLERPTIAADSQERLALKIANYFLTCIFFLEAAAKIIAFGFVLGRGTYLRQKWNMLDFSLLIFAILDVISMEFFQSYGTNRVLMSALRPVRLLRALRPLRLISRSHGLKLVLETLAVSLKPISHIVLICLLFFLIFGILGVQLFSGCFGMCILPKAQKAPHNASIDHPPTTSDGLVGIDYELLENRLAAVQTRNECLANSFIWDVESYNFDSLPNALMTLFVFATLDGWTDITRNGARCVGPDMQPKKNTNPWGYVYFISFLLITCFFALNMFVGVVVNNFQKVQKKMESAGFFKSKGRGATGKLIDRITSTISLHGQKGARVIMKRISNKLPARGKRVLWKLRQPKQLKKLRAPFWASYSPLRLLLFKVVSHKYFEVIVMCAVSLNVGLMTVEYYDMPANLRLAMDIVGGVFLSFLFCELVCKMMALGFCRYMQDRWNRLDLIVTISSLTALVLEQVDANLLPLNPSIVRVARLIRVVRVGKLWRAAISLRRLLDGIFKAIPQVINLSLLFGILFFIYASLGVQMYGRFDCEFAACEGLSEHAHFQNFGMAALTLFRIFTGDSWNTILKDILRIADDPAYCENEVLLSEGAVPCVIIRVISPIYFVSFVLLAQFVLINIVVAVLMNQIENVTKESLEEERVAEARRNEFREWELDQAASAPQLGTIREALAEMGLMKRSVGVSSLEHIAECETHRQAVDREESEPEDGLGILFAAPAEQQEEFFEEGIAMLFESSPNDESIAQTNTDILSCSSQFIVNEVNN